MNTVGADARPEYYRQSGAAVIEALHSHKMGLTNAEAERRHYDEGANVLPALIGPAAWRIGWIATVHPMTFGLLFSAVFAIAAQLDSLAAVLFGIAAISCGFRAYFCAPRIPRFTLPALSEQVTVLRNGQLRRIKPDALVLGDIVQLQAGQVVPADMRLLSAEDLIVDESRLFAEGHAAAKTARSVSATPALSARSNLLWAGTVITQGSAGAIVTGISAQTEIGHIILLTRTVIADRVRQPRCWSAGWWAAGAAIITMALVGWLTGVYLHTLAAGLLAMSLALLPCGLAIGHVVSLLRMRPHERVSPRLLDRLGTVDTFITNETAVARFKAFGLHIIRIDTDRGLPSLRGLSDDQLRTALASGSAVFGELTTEEKLRLVRSCQLSGHRVGLVAADLRDLPAQAQADVAIPKRNDLAALLASARAATVLTANMRSLAVLSTAALALLISSGLAGQWWFHIPLSLQPASILLLQAAFVPLAAAALMLSGDAYSATQLVARAITLSALAYSGYLLSFTLQMINPAFMDPTNPLVAGASSTVFSSFVLMLAVETGSASAGHHITRWSAMIYGALLLALLAALYWQPAQMWLGLAAPSGGNWLLAIVAAALYAAFIALQRHAHQHTRHAVAALHQERYGRVPAQF